MNRDEFMELVYETFADEPDNVLANGIIEAADAYAEHEKAQLFSEGATSDLISRTETAEHLRRVLGATVPISDYDEGFVDGVQFAISTVSTMPPAQPEPTRIIPETRAIPSDDDRVSLSERVTATFYDDEYEEWSQRTVTVRDVLDAVCDEYTVLPTIQSEPKEGHWIPHESPDGGEQYECSECGVLWEFNDGTPEDNEAYFCPKCGADMRGESE